MLPEITLKDASRDDVDRVAWWLGEEEISSKWFGHYACGDSVHRGYDPEHMLEASESEWRMVFADPHRRIFSIYNEYEQHIGECQIVFDLEGGAELSLLIGPKDRWHRGYGTSAVIALLDMTFEEFGLQRAWVSVSEDNLAALGLFGKLGFVAEANQELCWQDDANVLTTRNLGIDAVSYQNRRVDAELSGSTKRVVTVTGLPGAGAEAVGREVTRLVGSRFVGDEIRENLCRRLRRSPGELEWFEASSRSFWGRALRAMVLPTDWSAFFDNRYQWSRPGYEAGYDALDNQLTKKEYVRGLSAVIRSLAAEGNVVLNGQGSHLFVPRAPGTLSVFVSASPETRRQLIAEEMGLGTDEADKWLNQIDLDEVANYKHLLGADLLDMGQYDLTLNLDRCPSLGQLKSS